MIQLKVNFKKKGVNYEQVYKDEKLVIYSTSLPSYEVFCYRTHKPDIYHTDSYEQYPSDESFGAWAWSCSDVNSVNRIIKKHFPKHKFAIEGFTV